ncbi:MAG: hypothetical protein ACFE95_23070, partial [Candidatus Hodarchaeota archaeon]
MRKKIISLAIVSLLVFSVLGIFIIALASTQQTLPEFKTMDIGPELRKYTLPENNDIRDLLLDKDSGGGGAAIKQSTDYYDIGDQRTWAVYDIFANWYGYPIDFALFELRAIGDIAEVWVQVDLSYPDSSVDIVTTEHAEYILGEYESNIYPTCAEYFGAPDPWFGYGPFFEENGRHIILISNVRDTQYYFPEYPYFVIGFYWGLIEYLYERNIITLDSLAWDIISGPPIHAYDATTAHELQHLIHDDYNPADATFMNEGCSVFAETLCGYGIPWNDINSYLATPDNSLTEWDDQPYNDLADYGQAYLWAMYLTDHFGSDFLSNHVQSGLPGIDGLNYALTPHGTSFLEVYHDWRIANLIHWGDGVYNYESIDLNGKDVQQARVYEVPKLPVPLMTGSDFGSTITILGYDTGISTVKPFGTDYIRFDSGKYISKAWTETLYFDGDNIAIVGWQDVGGYWWSDDYDLMNTLLVGEAYVSPENPILELTTYWDIEDNWDFGFVQIYNSDTA